MDRSIGTFQGLIIFLNCFVFHGTRLSGELTISGFQVRLVQGVLFGTKETTLRRSQNAKLLIAPFIAKRKYFGIAGTE